jgi:hypothetical protein
LAVITHSNSEKEKMKNKELIFTLFLFITFNSISFAQNDFDFQKSNWEDNYEKAKSKLEKITELEEGKLKIITKKIFILDYPIKANYIFEKDKLIRGAIFFNKEDGNINVYKKFKDLLEKKYGKPTNDSDKDLRSNYPLNWDTILSYTEMGTKIYGSVWKNKETIIELLLLGDKYEGYYSLEIQYTQISYLKKKESTNLDKL